MFQVFCIYVNKTDTLEFSHTLLIMTFLQKVLLVWYIFYLKKKKKKSKEITTAIHTMLVIKS